MRIAVLTRYEVRLRNGIRIVPIMYCLLTFRLHYYGNASCLSRRYATCRDNYFCRVGRCRNGPLPKDCTCSKCVGGGGH